MRKLEAAHRGTVVRAPHTRGDYGGYRDQFDFGGQVRCIARWIGLADFQRRVRHELGVSSCQKTIQVSSKL